MVWKDTNPDLPTLLNVATENTSSSFDLLTRDPGRGQGFDTVTAEGELDLVRSRTNVARAAFMPLAMFDFAWN